MSQADLRSDSVIFARLKREYGPIKKLFDDIEKLKKNGTRKAEAKAKILQKRFSQIEANSTLVHIFFKELGIIKYERDELYSVMDMIGEQFYRFSNLKYI